MNERLKRFLDAYKIDEIKRYEKEKRKTLINAGLYEKEYSPDGFDDEEHPFYDDGTDKYYKKVPINITDEEYQELKKYTNKANTESEPNTNTIATALAIIAWIIFIFGFIAGIAFGNTEVEHGYYYNYTKKEFSLVIAATYWGISFISGTVFLGFAEIIKLLDGIKNKLDSNNK